MTDDTDQELNPYAAPNLAADGEHLSDNDNAIDPDPVGTTRRRLFIPSAALLLLAAASSLFYGAQLFDIFSVGLALGVAVQLAEVYGAINCFTLRSVRASHVGATLAVFPGFSPFVLLGIPFAIWLLIELRRPTARKAFEMVSGKPRRRVRTTQT